MKKAVGPWSEAERRIVVDNYPTGGMEACMRLLPQRDKEQIRSWVKRNGLRSGSQASYRQFSGETVSKADAPQHYWYVWEPLVLPEALPMRPGADDWKAIPSL